MKKRHQKRKKHMMAKKPACGIINCGKYGGINGRSASTAMA